MANNYTNFSFAFKVKGLKAKAWIERMVEKLSDACGDDTEDEEILELFPDWGYYLDCGFRTEIELIPGKKTQFYLYVFSEESGNVEYAVNFVQAILRRFDPKGKVGFDWAETCDRPRTGQFGGGAVVVTATRTKYISTTVWLQKEMSK